MTPGGPKHGALLIVAHPAGGDDEPEPLDSPEGSIHDEPDDDDQMGDDKDASCATCYAFQSSTGRCLRFPPKGGEWSFVDATDYCCEYKKGSQHEPVSGAMNESNQPAEGQPPETMS
jgi:hypothetical protein